jgi:hypothetical protein
LVTKADAAAAEIAARARLDGSVHADVEVKPPTPILCSVIGLIPSEDYWLMPCGMWKGPTVVVKSLADVKLTCTMEDSKHEVLAGDFKHAIAIANANLLYSLDQGVEHESMAC